MITGQVEYDVYVLMQQRSFWRWLFWWRSHSYEIILGQSFASAEEAARSAQLKLNAAGGKAIGISADAMVCCGRSPVIDD